MRRFGEAHDRLRRHRGFVPQAKPVVTGTGVARVAQTGLALVADEEQVAEHLDCIALLAFAEQRRHRHAKVLAQQVEQGRFEGGDDVNRGAQVKGLQAAAVGVAIREAGAHRRQQALHLADRLSDEQLTRVFQGLADLLAARHFTNAGVAGVVGHGHEVAGEERSVRSAQVQQD